jgi:hypothetical protein
MNAAFCVCTTARGPICINSACNETTFLTVPHTTEDRQHTKPLNHAVPVFNKSMKLSPRVIWAVLPASTAACACVCTNGVPASGGSLAINDAPCRRWLPTFNIST